MAGEAIREFNRLMSFGPVAGLTDGQLLERFATTTGDPAEMAFEGLVARHGPMVLRVCRATLRDPHDVDDAFQATFLVLVRRANSIGERDLLGPWLYGVARRVSLKARATAARRRKREGGYAEDRPGDPAEVALLDIRPVLHEELGRLPEKYRKPVVLCHLQGLTHAEAAHELAWPVGTVSVRLARARKLLHDRLTRRGLTATATLWAAGLASDASAAVPQVLITSTIKLATARTLAAGAASATVATLTRRTLTTMTLAKLRWMLVPLAAALGASGGVVATERLTKKAGPPAISAKSTKPKVPALAPVPAGGMPSEPEIKVDPPLVNRNGTIELDPPPGYFDLPAPDKKDGTDPPLIKAGQVLIVEVLQTLPGRPIQGEYVVRPDGTISLGFYGDLRVVGLNRYQAKVKLIEHLRRTLMDDVLGLIKMDREGKYLSVPPVESGRAFVDDGYIDRGSNPPRPAPKGGDRDEPFPTPKDPVDELRDEITKLRKELDDLRNERRKPK